MCLCVHWHTLVKMGGLGLLMHCFLCFWWMIKSCLWGLMTVCLPWKHWSVFASSQTVWAPKCGTHRMESSSSQGEPTRNVKKRHEPSERAKPQAKGLREGFHCNGSSLSGLAASARGTPEEENRAVLSIWALTPLLQGWQWLPRCVENQINNEPVWSLCVRGRIQTLNFMAQSFRGHAKSWYWEITTTVKSIIWMMTRAVVSHTISRLWNNNEKMD